MKIPSLKALTMVELLVALVISSVLILMVGALSNVAFSSHNQLRKEGDVYSDLSYGFNLLKYSVQNASTVGVANQEFTLVAIPDPDNPYPDNPYNRTFKNDNNTDFKYIDHLDGDSEHIIIQGASGLNFDFRCEKDGNDNWLVDSCNSDSKIFHVTLTGIKDKESFNLVSDVMRRN